MMYLTDEIGPSHDKVALKGLQKAKVEPGITSWHTLCPSVHDRTQHRFPLQTF